MKKIISLILCIIIALSVSPTAFAAAGTIVPGEAQTATLNKGKSAVYTFTATESAAYLITVKALNKSWSNLIMECENDKSAGGVLIEALYDNIDNNSVFYQTVAVYKGYKYKITLKNIVDTLEKEDIADFGISETSKLEFSLKKVDLPEVAFGGTYTAKNMVEKHVMKDTCFFMIPKTSGYYNFHSQPANLNSTHLEIISDKCEFNRDNNSSSATGNSYVNCTVYMEKGHMYIIEISGFTLFKGNTMILDIDHEPFEAEVTFTISDGSGLEAQSITCENNKISMRRKEISTATFTISPEGYIPFDHDEVKITSSNSKAADVRDYEIYNEHIYLTIESYRYGKTTFTVTLPNGVSAELKVSVKPGIIIFFENLFSFFS